jgi:hypothetical protein
MESGDLLAHDLADGKEGASSAATRNEGYVVLWHNVRAQLGAFEGTKAKGFRIHIVRFA